MIISNFADRRFFMSAAVAGVTDIGDENSIRSGDYSDRRLHPPGGFVCLYSAGVDQALEQPTEALLYKGAMDS